MNLTPLQIEDVELMLLRKYQKAHKDADPAMLDRLTIALEEVWELVKEARKQ